MIARDSDGMGATLYSLNTHTLCTVVGKHSPPFLPHPGLTHMDQYNDPCILPQDIVHHVTFKASMARGHECLGSIQCK